MKNELTQYFVAAVLLICFIIVCSDSSVKAQSLSNSPSEPKDFGSTLKKIEKKKKNKAKNEKPPSPIVTETKPVNETEAKPSNDDEFIRVETILVTSEVLVFDTNGNPVKNLKKEEFIVTEDNQPQEISTFITGDSELIPRSIVLIIDHSFSQMPYLETSIEAAKILVDKLNPNDRMAIVSDNVELLQNFTNDKTLLKTQLESLKSRVSSGKVGNSKQYSALMATLNEMFDEKELRPIIIFQTDGDQLAELKGESANVTDEKTELINFSYKDILTATEKTRATIYTIIPGINFNGISKKERLEKVRIEMENSERIAAQLNNFTLKPNRHKIPARHLELRTEWMMRYQEAITEIAKFTGGWANHLEKPEQAGQIYEEILSKINERYVIGYYPLNQARDGKIRNLVMEVRGHPEYKIISRKTYILR